MNRSKPHIGDDGKPYSVRAAPTACDNDMCEVEDLVLVCPECRECIQCSAGDCCLCGSCDSCHDDEECDHHVCDDCELEKKRPPTGGRVRLRKGASMSVMEKAKDESVKVAYRIAARQFVRTMRVPILSMFKKEGADRKLVDSVRKFLDSEFGLDTLSFVLGCGISVVPYLSSNEKAALFAEELRVGGAATILNVGIDRVTTLFGPIIREMVKTINAQPPIGSLGSGKGDRPIELPAGLRDSDDADSEKEKSSVKVSVSPGAHVK